ncbi:MAG: flavoprotein [Planctomycetia bacterium]
MEGLTEEPPADGAAPRRPRILWGITGSVAAVRADALAAELLTLGDVAAVATEAARRFLPPLPAEVRYYVDADEWAAWKTLGDPVLHIELRRWADLFVVAPLTAGTLAKLAGGLCDNLLTSTARAWDFANPVVVAPAMNTKMWEHPTTADQLRTLRDWGVAVVEPVEKMLACADVGMGALAPPATIAVAVAAALRSRSIGPAVPPKEIQR